jgi:branched-subunit amino acid permease
MERKPHEVGLVRKWMIALLIYLACLATGVGIAQFAATRTAGVPLAGRDAG